MSEPIERTCAATPGCKRQPTHGMVCRAHLDRLGVILREIEDEAIHMEIRPSMALSLEHGGGGLASEQAPVRIAPLAMLDARTKRWEPDAQSKHPLPAPKSFGPWCLFCEHQTCTAWRAGRRRDLHDDEHDAGSAQLASVLDEMHNWARLVREERDLHQPDYITLTGERDLLTRQLPWCVEQDWIDEMYSDLNRLLTQIKTVNNSREVPAGTCSTIYADGECGGNVWHVVIEHPDEPDEPGFRCGSCRRVWTGTEAVRKRDQMWRDEQEKKASA